MSHLVTWSLATLAGPRGVAAAPIRKLISGLSGIRNAPCELGEVESDLTWHHFPQITEQEEFQSPLPSSD